MPLDTPVDELRKESAPKRTKRESKQSSMSPEEWATRKHNFYVAAQGASMQQSWKKIQRLKQLLAASQAHLEHFGAKQLKNEMAWGVNKFRTF